jgi:hypothetical protein
LVHRIVAGQNFDLISQHFPDPAEFFMAVGIFLTGFYH